MLAYFDTDRASNGPTEAVNLLIEKIRRVGHVPMAVIVRGARLGRLGTDYALLLVARYRQELRRHADRHEAMAVALHRAGPAIIASASTVVAGMLCLMFTETKPR